MRGLPRSFLPLLLTVPLLFSGPTVRAAESAGEEFSPEELARGRRIYGVHCARCHGMQGLGGTGPSLARPVLAQAKDFDALLSVVALGIPGTAMPNWRMLARKDQRVVAGFVHSLGRAPTTPLPGDAARGREIFTRSACTSCHSVGGQGGVKGPDLTAVGLRRGAERLRRMLLEPGAEKMTTEEGYTDYLPVRVVTVTGREIDGLRVNEDGFTIQLRDLEDRLHSFRKTEIRELKKNFNTSIMPSFAGVFQPAELDDLVAYLANLRGKP